MDDEMLGLLIAMTGIFVVAGIIVLVLYLIDAIARFIYLKVRNYDNAWMAFIPIVNLWASVEATYGDSETVNIYGWDAPAIVAKLWPVVTYILSGVINVIPALGQALSLILYVLNIAVLVMIFRDMMERLEYPQEGPLAIIAVVIPIVSSIMLLTTVGKFAAGSQDYRNDDRVLSSQAQTGGPLSFLNGNK